MGTTRPLAVWVAITGCSAEPGSEDTGFATTQSGSDAAMTDDATDVGEPTGSTTGAADESASVGQPGSSDDAAPTTAGGEDEDATTTGSEEAGTGSGEDPEVIVTDETWVCDGPVSNLVVEATIPSGGGDAIWLETGCSGDLTIIVETSAEDGVKVKGAADLVVTGSITCNAEDPGAHQDGVQAMGGTNVRFDGLTIRCPNSHGGGGFFVNQGGTQDEPVDVVCENCDLYHGAMAYRVGASSTDSGVRDSIAYQGRFGECGAILAAANGPIDENNVCNADPPAGWPPPGD